MIPHSMPFAMSRKHSPKREKCKSDPLLAQPNGNPRMRRLDGLPNRAYETKKSSSIGAKPPDNSKEKLYHASNGGSNAARNV